MNTDSLSYEHHFWVEPDQHDALASALAIAGCLVAEIGGRSMTAVDSRPWADATTAERAAQLLAIAERHGAEYDGGGTYVGPLSGLA